MATTKNKDLKGGRTTLAKDTTRNKSSIGANENKRTTKDDAQLKSEGTRASKKEMEDDE
jgi:hypothetical protein